MSNQTKSLCSEDDVEKFTRALSLTADDATHPFLPDLLFKRTSWLVRWPSHFFQSICIRRRRLPPGYLNNRLVPIITHETIPYAWILTRRYRGRRIQYELLTTGKT